MKMIVWIGEWVAVAVASVGATLWAQSVPETPTSVLVAFIAVSMSSIGLLGWVLRQQMVANTRATDEMVRIRIILARIGQRVGVSDRVTEEEVKRERNGGGGTGGATL